MNARRERWHIEGSNQFLSSFPTHNFPIHVGPAGILWKYRRSPVTAPLNRELGPLAGPLAATATRTRPMLAQTLLALLAIVLVSATQDTVDCMLYKEEFKAHYDLRGLRSNFGYSVPDHHGRNFTYIFNICGPVSWVPPQCKEKVSKAGPEAYQIIPETGECFILANATAEPQIELYDPNNPSLGVYLVNTPGDICPNGHARSWELFLECANADGLNVDGQTIFEDDCGYSISIPTRYACPLECPFVAENGGLCSGKGFCAMDRDAGSPRCFCNDGRTGADCSESTSPGKKSGLTTMQGVLVALIVLLSIMVFLGLGALYYISHLKVQKEVPMASIEPENEAETIFTAADS